MWSTRAESVCVERGTVQGVRVCTSTVAQTESESLTSNGDKAFDKQDPSEHFNLLAAMKENEVERESGSARREVFLDADCVVVNADLAAAELSLLPPSLRRSRYDERSELASSHSISGVGPTGAETDRTGQTGAGHKNRVENAGGTGEDSTKEGLLRADGWRRLHSCCQ